MHFTDIFAFEPTVVFVNFYIARGHVATTVLKVFVPRWANKNVFNTPYWCNRQR